MSEYKNQHYVPQFLLRGWTDDEKVFVYHIENEEEYPKTPISNLCYGKYFYGPPEIEKRLGPIEDAHARIIHDLRDGKSIEVLEGDDFLFFCMFVLLQRNRTKQTKEETTEYIDNLAKEYIRTKIKSGAVEQTEIDGRPVLDMLDEVKITKENPLSYPMLFALTGYTQILDLDVAIIENTSEKEFIISDHPVVYDNRRFKDEWDRYLVGAQSKGLQIFIPLSDKIQLLLYDPDSYFVEYTDEEDRYVETNSENVVEGLNDIQLINASESVYYRNSGKEAEMTAAKSRLKEYIDQNRIAFERLSPEEHDFETDNQIIGSGQTTIGYSPALPFVKQRLETDFEVYRKPRVAEEHREFMQEILDEEREKLDSDKNE